MADVPRRPRRRRDAARRRTTACIAALGPKMLELARDPHRRHPPVPRHARAHRKAPARASAPTGSSPASRASCSRPTRRRPATSPASTSRPTSACPNYSNNWKRQGFTDDDLADGGSDRLVDALVAWGDEATIAARVQEHRDAGADHVCIQVLTDDPGLPGRGVAGAGARRWPDDRGRESHPSVCGPASGGKHSVGWDLAVTGPGRPPVGCWLRGLCVRQLPPLRRVGGVAPRAGGRASGARRARVVRHALRGARPVARHGHRCVDRRARHQAGALGRRQHPLRRADGDGRRAARCSSTSSTGSRADDPVVIEALRTRTFYVVPARQPRRRRVGAGRPARYRRSSMRPWPWPDAHRWPGLHAEDIDGDGRILHMRIADPNGAWMAHPDDAAAADARCRWTAPPPVRPRYRLLDEGTIVDHDGFTIPTPRPPEGLDMNRNFPAGWGTGVRGSGDHPLTRAGDRRARAGDRRPPERLRLQRVPHERRRAAAPVDARPPTRRCRRSTCGRGSSSPRSARALTGYTVALGLRGLHVGQDRHDERRRRRLGVRAPRRVRLDDRVLGRRARGHRHQAVDALLVPRPDRRGGARRAAVGRRAPPRDVRRRGTRSSTRSSARSSSAAGTTSASGPTRRWRCCATRSRRTPTFAVYQALAAPRSRSSTRTRSRSAAARGASRSGIANTGWLPTYVTARGAKEQPDAADHRRGQLAAASRSSAARPASQLGQLEGRAALRFAGTGTTARPIGVWRRGSCEARPGRASTSSPVTNVLVRATATVELSLPSDT